MSKKLVVKAINDFSPYPEMYKVIDFLNKNLKEKQIILGLTKDKEKNKMTITIYEV
ncbi:MAG: hypothetical protein PWQ67_1826 [Clostridia bacterium]|nr:hypothetical protein [Clostridia bacterium]MDN5323372.1 hypothetical protein [Clostridia bacterium]